jgi:hypothetical protein
MGQILGLGVTHFPPLSGPDENLGRILKRALDDPAVPERLRHPEGWPAAMREEYGDDAGLTAARHHREALVAGFRNVRRVTTNTRILRKTSSRRFACWRMNH